MTAIYISIGSNIDAEQHIRSCARELRRYYADIRFSPVYESEAVGFAGDNFLNLVAACETEQSLEDVISTLRSIENIHLRDRKVPRFSPRTLDLDLLLFGEKVENSQRIVLPRPEIYQNAFVLQPLADMAPDITDPLQQQTYQELWTRYDKTRQQLWQIEFDFSESLIN